MVIENLRTAKHRCEQLAILSVLRLYIDQVPSKELIKLKETYTEDVIDKITNLKHNPTVTVSEFTDF